MVSSVPGEGIEPPTNGLQNRCSTAELTRHYPENTRILTLSQKNKSEIGTGLAPEGTNLAFQRRVDCGGCLAVVLPEQVGVDPQRDVGLAWPRRLLMVTISTPASISWLAWVCRKAWNVTSGIPMLAAKLPQAADG